MNNYRTYNKLELAYQNTKYGGNWIRMGENNKEKEFTLYPTGDATLNGRIYVALPKGPISYEDKMKYNII
jgi:hypothetical protein